MQSRQRAHRGCLLLRGEHTHRAINHLAPGPAFWRGRASIVEARNDITIIGQARQEEPSRPRPTVIDGCARRLAIHTYDQRIFFRGIELSRFDQPTIELNAVTDVNLKEFRSRSEEHTSELQSL